jgi:hypothetical protein
MGVSVLWAVLDIAMGISGDVFAGGFSLATPGTLNFVLLLLLPVGFFWAIATMVWRAQEMRIVSRQISDLAAAVRAENIATDPVVNVSQAIRREVAAVGDGIERAIARASEPNCSSTTKWRRSSALTRQ